MSGVLQGFVTIGVLIAVGALVAHLGIVDLAGGRLLATLSFFVASPALLLTTVAESDASVILARPVVAMVASVAVVMSLYAVTARYRFGASPGHLMIGAMTAGYVNSANLGIPIAAYVLGDAALVAPVLLLQLLVIQPLALMLLDADTSAHRASLGRSRCGSVPASRPRTGLSWPPPLPSSSSFTPVSLACSVSRWESVATISSPSSCSPRCRRRRTSSFSRPATTGLLSWPGTPSS